MNLFFKDESVEWIQQNEISQRSEMIKKYRTFLFVTLMATALLVLVLAMYGGQLTFGFASILAGLIITLSLLAASDSSFGRRMTEAGIQGEAMETDGVPSDMEFSHRIAPELLAMLSHELRTPMNVLLGVADLMRLTDLTHKQLGYLRAIQGSGDSLLILLENFLDFSEFKSDGIKLDEQEFDVVELLERVFCAMDYQAYSRGVELMVDAPVESSLMVLGDPHRVRQVLVNLIGNRISNGEGEIVVQVTIAVEAGNTMRLHVSVINRNDSAFDDLAERLSNPAEFLDLETDDMRQGSKIGLAVCKRLIEKMGGQIGVVSTDNNVTRAWVSIPLLRSEPQPGTQATEPDVLKGLSAIVVSGNPILDRIICRYLEAWGMFCVVAADILFASTLIRNDHDSKFSVAIIDANLIETNGPLITSQIQETAVLADLPLVMLTTIGEAFKADSISISDNIRFVTKPLLPGAFRYNLLKVIDSATVRMENQRVPEHLRILIAEDNTANSHLLIAMLRSLGCDPDYVEDGRAALEILARNPYDLVLMDFEMPGLDGDQVTEELRTNSELYASQPVVIAVTATNSVEHRRRCLESGMNGFIAKPIRLEELKKGLRQWLRPDNIHQLSNAKDVEQLTAVADEFEFKILEQLYNRIGQGNAEILNDYIDLFLSDSLRRLEDLHVALLAEDTKVLSRQSHALKGACLEIGHLRMSRYCNDLREAGEQGKLDDASLILDILDEEFEKLRTVLEARKVKGN